MTVPDSKGLVRQFLTKVLVERDAQVADAIVSASATTDCNLTMHSALLGPSGVKQLADQYDSAFADLRLFDLAVISEGDAAAARWNWEGRHKGDLPRVPKTEAVVRGSGASFHRISAGQIVASELHWHLPAPMASEADRHRFLAAYQETGALARHYSTVRSGLVSFLVTAGAAAIGLYFQGRQYPGVLLAFGIVVVVGALIANFMFAYRTHREESYFRSIWHWLERPAIAPWPSRKYSKTEALHDMKRDPINWVFVAGVVVLGFEYLTGQISAWLPQYPVLPPPPP